MTETVPFTLQRGDTGDQVRFLQYGLICKGARVESTGVYGWRTAEAVAIFQRLNGIEATGIADMETIDALATPP